MTFIDNLFESNYEGYRILCSGYGMRGLLQTLNIISKYQRVQGINMAYILVEVDDLSTKYPLYLEISTIVTGFIDLQGKLLYIKLQVEAYHAAFIKNIV